MTSIALAIALSVTALPPPADAVRLTPELKLQTIDAAIDALRELYVFPELVDKAEKVLRAEQNKKAYDGITDGKQFAEIVGTQIREALKDSHIRMNFSEKPLPVREARNRVTEAEIAAEKRKQRLMNGGFESVVRLAGNVGYMDVRGFVDTEISERPAAAAMQFVADTDALIIDLRLNGGGWPQAVQNLCSYFFGPTPVHLNTLIWRGGRRDEFWTLESVKGPRYLDKDVYVLISGKTGSAAEEFSYNLQNLKRATLVGETTWGGANPGGPARLNDHFLLFVPTGRAENPITKTNWEGVGVKPDVAVPQNEALKTAHRMALEKLLSNATTPEDKQRLEMALKSLG
jgi:retinol-binding protein 3